ncbi:BMC domain-containing protein [Collinsella tanakaei]|uniref:BMC domain-containing protein n=1 Tax=Collinsella ihumii TaxID=1720204 RepID=A0AAW7JZ25_9ACTN|nr:MULTISPECIES: BMC domain-containing protein [Collinsella]MBM6777436.1 BMC domain-containing protein [Collinsella tanakaei]MBM6786178.1 BMC domain-containing protein [Collinsella tanakaei]MDN0068730.1 BMC domain-containing protein [Collinsella ihumii]OUO61860.1 microcompartment protein [Collinsella sp. An271]
MRYQGEQAIGLIETIGMVPALLAADAMLKAGDTELVSYENVGSTLVTVIVTGDVAACEAAVAAGAEAAASIGKLTAHNVMKRPVPAVGDVVSVHDVDY